MGEIGRLPIGIQSFEDIIRGRFLYVDKTKFVYDLVSQTKQYFLARPRRFGKSLFLSTLQAYFLGKKDLFSGLALEQKELELAQEEGREPWLSYPVLYLDLNSKKYETETDLDTILCAHLNSPELRFSYLMEQIHAKSGRQVVFLVDEYDKPLIQTLKKPELNEEYRATLKAFFGCLKSCDAHVKFAFLTGVTKFSQVSVFSDLNHLNDISMTPRFDAICGMTEEELQRTFPREIENLAEKNRQSVEESLAQLKRLYDGYHFSYECEGMYNPFSVLNTLFKETYSNYWFQTGTPTFLLEELKRNDYDLREIASGVTAMEDDFMQFRVGSDNPIPLLYQSGYLTIKGYDGRFGEYTLDFPNEEVKYGFLNFILPGYTATPAGKQVLFIGKFVKDIEAGRVDDFMERMQAVLEGLPYGSTDKLVERDVQVACYLVFTLMGQFTRTEVHSAKGRADAVVWTKDVIYVFEFKADGSTAEDALKQIDDKGYSIPYQCCRIVLRSCVKGSNSVQYMSYGKF